MNTLKPFRFAVSAGKATSQEEWAAKARRIEQLGYSTMVIPDHLLRIFAPFSALLAAAQATHTLRIGSYVFNNDFRHPVLLAKEVATLDFLSGGRFELGLGAGYARSEYEQSGLTYDPASVRIRRLGEAIEVVKRVLAEESASFSGEFYTINQLNGFPKPIQRPHPPLLIGGAGKRILSLAARKANIVGIIPKALSDGSGLDFTDSTQAATMQKIEWIRQAAENRFDDLELNILAFQVTVTDDYSQVVQQMSKRFSVKEEEVSDIPHCLIGTVDQISEALQKRREKYGISYITVFDFENTVEALAPVVARLAGK
ncbi:TIGR03621 family F420-dependent LLM class oxidoreductase [Ktedonosporobacter rubrisoli]|uniref:TIGR03621 family F420-dependent LLM class oxidoreductase n=1 Tax=Ktedonosporobacter rubrisoli TaxID=2509675 RepID=A0A4P6K501_KTERU|nr:TIGR03621 family F420-dependent LLM class oxidoreductase [Ktedonosporobacter rubrisoli]QBD82920.1 TIGR03621 family F420-dependent LLM class oxidoreductase [Ktedonosporobacter rubrisoli]